MTIKVRLITEFWLDIDDTASTATIAIDSSKLYSRPVLPRTEWILENCFNWAGQFLKFTIFALPRENSFIPPPLIVTFLAGALLLLRGAEFPLDVF